MYRNVPRTAAAVAVTAAAATVAVALAGPAGATTATSAEHFAYGGNAYGSHVALGDLANVGKTAYTPMCTTDAGARHLNKTAKVDLGAVGYVGAVTSKMVSKHNGSTSSSNASTHTATTKLLTGMIRLNAVTTAATVSHTGSKYGMTGSSTFLGLRIAGKSFPASPKANSSYSLPGLGSLTLNEQRFGRRKGIPTATVIALDLKLGSSNTLGLPTGRIVIGQSTATLLQTHRVPTGAAWATSISVSSVAGSGRTAAAYTGCGGTASKGNSTNDLLGVTLPNGVATLGVAKSTVHTHDTAAKTSSVSRNRIAGANLLNGMIKVKALSTQANATADAKGHRTRSATGTSVLGLVVNGQAMAAPPLGQQQSIPGLGTLTFGYSHKTTNGGIVVYGLRLVLGSTQGNVPAGAVITIGAARANASV